MLTLKGKGRSGKNIECRFLTAAGALRSGFKDRSNHLKPMRAAVAVNFAVVQHNRNVFAT